MNPLVLIDRAPPLVTITINRPAVRNCVDRPTADALGADWTGPGESFWPLLT